MKRFFPVIIIFLFSSSFVFGQFENFDLSKYKLPRIKRHQLDLSFHTNGDINTRYFIGNNDSNRLTQINRNEFYGDGELDYNYYLNSPEFQTTANVNTSLDYSRINNSGSWVNDEDFTDFNNSLSLSYDTKYFISENNWFIELSPTASFRYSKENDFISEGEIYDTHFNGAIGIGGGTGRIEQVQDFRHAILILREISKSGSKRNLTEAEILELSRLISELKNKRFFDARIRKKKDLVAIDSFLVEKGVLNRNSNISYFVGLEDMWEYGALQPRESGKQFSLLVFPGYYLSERKHDHSITNILRTFDLNSSLGYYIRKPVSLKWQSDFDFILNYQYFKKLEVKNISTGAAKHYFRAYSSANLGYYPNTRTYLRLFGRVELHNWSASYLLDERFSFRFYLVSSVNYYISQRLRLGGSMRFGFDKDGIFNEETEDTTNKNFGYSLQLSYAMF